MNSLTIKVYIASGYNANQGKLILNNVEYPFDNVMPDSDNAYELYFGFANPITLPVTGQLYITNTSDEIEPFDHNGTIQVNQGYGIWNYDSNNPCYMEFELEEDGQAYGDPSIEFGSVSNPWYYNSAHVSTCNTPQPSQPDLTGNWYVVNDATEGFHFISSNLVQWDMCDHESTSDINLNWIEGTAIGNYGPWYFADGSSKYYYNATDNTLGDSYEDGPIENIYTYSASGLSCGTPYSVDIITSGLGTVDGIHSGDQTGQYYLTAIPAQGWVFDHWTISGWDTQDNPLDTSFPDAHQTVYVYFVQEGPGPQPTEKHIYLCDNSGAHLAEMTNTGSTWNVSGAFTSGQYSIRATVEGEYNDAWFKFYQTSGDNRVFVGAGDDPSFEDIGTYIMIDDILTSFSLTEDQETDYYVVNYQNTDAMTVSTVETIVNSYIGELNIPTDTSDLTNGAGFITVSDVSAMSYITMTDISSLGYVSGTELSSMSYIDQTSLSSMAYVDNTYLSTYMNNVVGNIESILQTI